MNYPLRERVINAIQHKDNPFCPYVIWIKDAALKEKLARFYGVEDVFCSIISNHIEFCGHIKAAVHPLPDGTYLDEFGTVLELGSIPHVVQPALSEPSLKGYTFPDMAADPHFSKVPAYLEKYPERFRVVQFLEMFFERAWNLRGMQEFMMDIAYEPAFVEELMDNLLEIMLRCVDRTISDYGDSIDAIGWTDDYGGQNNLLISPRSWRKLFKPRLAILSEHIRKTGKFVYFHSCGNIEAIMPDLIEIGVDLLNPIQPETMDIFKLKQEYGRDICFFGGLGTQHGLTNGSPVQVREEVQKCILKLGENGGLVAAPAKEIMSNVPFENAVALIDALRLQDFA